MEAFRSSIEFIGMGIDVVGAAVVVIGATMATLRFLYRVARHAMDAYRDYRQRLGRSVLLGLEFLVAGDIIRTVAVAPTRQGRGAGAHCPGPDFSQHGHRAGTRRALAMGKDEGRYCKRDDRSPGGSPVTPSVLAAALAPTPGNEAA